MRFGKTTKNLIQGTKNHFLTKRTKQEMSCNKWGEWLLPSSMLSLGVAAEAKCDKKINEVEPRRRNKSSL